MPYYLMLSKLTERGRETVRKNPERIREVNAEVNQRGCRVVHQFALLGEHDFATIIEAPDNWNMHRLAIDLGSRGTIDTETMPALRVEDFIAYMKEQEEEDRAANR